MNAISLNPTGLDRARRSWKLHPGWLQLCACSPVIWWFCKRLDDGSYACKGSGVVRRRTGVADAGETAVSGRFVMRPIRP